MDINLRKLITLDNYICKTNCHNLTLTELSILLSLLDSPKDYEALAESIGRSVDNLMKHLSHLRLSTAKRPSNIGFIHVVQGSHVHLTTDGKAWIDDLYEKQ